MKMPLNTMDTIGHYRKFLAYRKIKNLKAQCYRTILTIKFSLNKRKLSNPSNFLINYFIICNISGVWNFIFFLYVMRYQEVYKIPFQSSCAERSSVENFLR